MNMHHNLSFLLFIIISIIIIPFISTKKVKTTVSLNVFNREHYKYLTKFSYQIGQGSVEIIARLDKPVNETFPGETIPLALYAILDDDWPEVREASTCQEKEDKSRMTTWFNIPKNGEWSEPRIGTLSQLIRTRVWYMFVFDCKEELSRTQLVKGQKIHFEITMTNSDNSHFTEEENGMTMWYFIELLILVIFFAANSWRFIRFYKTEESWDIPFLLLNIAILFEAFSILLEWVHLLIYANNGTGSFILDLLSQFCGIFSQFIITVLIILIATGWSIDFYQIEEIDLYLPLIVMIGIFHLIIIGIGRINDEEPTKFHDYESIPGYIIMVLRLIFFGIFIYSIYNTYSKSSSNDTKKKFIIRFGILGTIYLLALPIIVLISSIFVAPYVRNKVIVFGTLTLQIGTSIILTYLLSSKKSKYHQISMKGRTLLPSGKLDQKLNEMEESQIWHDMS